MGFAWRLAENGNDHKVNAKESEVTPHTESGRKTISHKIKYLKFVRKRILTHSSKQFAIAPVALCHKTTFCVFTVCLQYLCLHIPCSEFLMTNVTIFDLIPQPLAFKSALRLLEYHRLPQEGQVPLLESGLAPNPERRHSQLTFTLLRLLYSTIDFTLPASATS